MADIKEQIGAAQNQGYTPSEIIGHLSTGKMASQIKAAKAEKWSDDEIIVHLGGTATPTDTSFLSALKYGADQGTENFASTLEAGSMLTGDQNLKGMAKDARGAIEAPKNYKPSNFANSGVGEWYDPRDYNWSDAPRAIAETVPQMAATAASAVTGATLGSVAGPGGALAGGFLGAAGPEILTTFGPIALERAKAKGKAEPDMEDWLYAAGGSAVSGLISGLSGPGLGRLNSELMKTSVKGGLKKLGTEFGTEAAQDVTQQVANTAQTPNGVNVDLKQSMAAGTLGAGARAVTGAPMTAVRGAVAGAKAAKAPFKVGNAAAATRVANRLKAAADESNLVNLKDSNPNRYENSAMVTADTVHIQMAEELKAAVADLRPELTQDDGSLSGLVKKATALAGLRGARNKRKGLVTPSQREALEARIGSFDKGQKILQLVDESNELTNLLNRGTLGGLSKHAEILNPLSGSDVTRAAKTLLMGGHALGGVSSAGITIAGQAGTYGAARGVDALTGRRYPIQKFVNDFAGKDTGPSPTQGTHSLAMHRFQQKQAALAAKEANKVRREPTLAKADAYPESRSIFRQVLEDKSLAAQVLSERGSELSDTHYARIQAYAKYNQSQVDKAEVSQAAQAAKAEAQRAAEEARNERDAAKTEAANAKAEAANIRGDIMIEAAQRQVDGTLDNAFVEETMGYITPAQTASLIKAVGRLEASKEKNKGQSVKAIKATSEIAGLKAALDKNTEANKALLAKAGVPQRAMGNIPMAPPRAPQSGPMPTQQMDMLAPPPQSGPPIQMPQMTQPGSGQPQGISAQALGGGVPIQNANQTPQTTLPAPQFEPRPTDNLGPERASEPIRNQELYDAGKAEHNRIYDEISAEAQALPQGRLRHALEDLVKLTKADAKAHPRKRANLLQAMKDTLKDADDRDLFAAITSEYDGKSGISDKVIAEREAAYDLADAEAADKQRRQREAEEVPF